MTLNSAGSSSNKSKNKNPKSLWNRLRGSIAGIALAISGLANGQEAPKSPSIPNSGEHTLSAPNAASNSFATELRGAETFAEQIKKRTAADLKSSDLKSLKGYYGTLLADASPLAAQSAPSAVVKQQIESTVASTVSSALRQVGIDGTIGQQQGKNVLWLKMGKEWNDSTAIVGEIVVGQAHREALINLGFRLTPEDTLVVTHQDLRQLLTHNFVLGSSGASETVTDWASQTTIGFTWKHINTEEVKSLIQSYSISGYKTQSKGQDFGKREFSQTNGVLFELYEQALKTHGITRTGISGSVDLQVSQDFNMTLRAGAIAQEANTFVPGPTEVSPSAGATLNYQINPRNILAGQIDTSKFTTVGSLKWTHAVNSNTTMGIEGYVSKPKVGEMVQGARFNLKFTGNFDGMGSRSTGANHLNSRYTPQPRVSLLAETTKSPFYRAMGVEVAVDTTVKPVLLVSVDKSGLPAGANVDTVTGDINYPVPVWLGAFVGAINLNNAMVIPGSVFTTSNGLMTIKTRELAGFLSAGIQTIAATYAGGVFNIVVQKGSVKTISITYTPNPTEALTVPAAPSTADFACDDTTNLCTPAVGVNLAQYELSVNGGTYGPVVPTTLYPGLQTLRFRKAAVPGVNQAGNIMLVNFTPSAPVLTGGNQSYSIAYGTGLTIAAPVATDADNEAITPIFTNDPTNPVGITMDAVGVITVASTVPAGSYTFKRKVRDAGGVLSANEQIFTVAIGLLVPNAPAGIAANDTSNTIAYPTGFDLSAHEISNDAGTSWYTINPTSVFTGNQTVLIRKKAVSGVSTASTPVTLNFTNSAPVISPSQVTSLTVNEGTAGNLPVLTASDGDGDSVVMSLSGLPTGISLNGGSITVAASIAPGVYTGYLIASDGITTSRLSITITVLTATLSAPSGLALNTPALTNNTRPTLSWAAVGGATSYSVRINGGAWVDVGNATSYQLPLQGDGSKTLQVQANRLSGSTTLTSSASTSVSVTIDTVAPTLSSVVLADWEGTNGIIGSATFTMSKSIASVNSVSMVFARLSNSIVPGINLVSKIIGNQVIVTPGARSFSWTDWEVLIVAVVVDAAGNTSTVTTRIFWIV